MLSQQTKTDAVIHSLRTICNILNTRQQRKMYCDLYGEAGNKAWSSRWWVGFSFYRCHVIFYHMIFFPWPKRTQMWTLTTLKSIDDARFYGTSWTGPLKPPWRMNGASASSISDQISSLYWSFHSALCLFTLIYWALTAFSLRGDVSATTQQLQYLMHCVRSNEFPLVYWSLSYMTSTGCEANQSMN